MKIPDSAPLMTAAAAAANMRTMEASANSADACLVAILRLGVRTVARPLVTAAAPAHHQHVASHGLNVHCQHAFEMGKWRSVWDQNTLLKLLLAGKPSPC